jgi:hypothetical protein
VNEFNSDFGSKSGNPLEVHQMQSQMNATDDGFISEFGTNPMVADFDEE